jgi:hypothetical protein
MELTRSLRSLFLFCFVSWQLFRDPIVNKRSVNLKNTKIVLAFCFIIIYNRQHKPKGFTNEKIHYQVPFNNAWDGKWKSQWWPSPLSISRSFESVHGLHEAPFNQQRRKLYCLSYWGIISEIVVAFTFQSLYNIAYQKRRYVMEAKASALRAIVQQIYVAKTLEEGAKIAVDFLKSPTCPIRASENHIMLQRVNGCPTLVKLQFFLTNSLLRYEGMRVR